LSSILEKAIKWRVTHTVLPIGEKPWSLILLPRNFGKGMESGRFSRVWFTDPDGGEQTYDGFPYSPTYQTSLGSFVRNIVRAS
jgi:hypothetical protein